MSLHVVGLTEMGRVFYTRRDRSFQGWTPWEDVIDKVGDPNIEFSKIGCATVGSALHICGLTKSGRLLHTIRTSIWENPEGSGKPGWVILAALYQEGSLRCFLTLQSQD